MHVHLCVSYNTCSYMHECGLEYRKLLEPNIASYIATWQHNVEHVLVFIVNINVLLQLVCITARLLSLLSYGFSKRDSVAINF